MDRSIDDFQLIKVVCANLFLKWQAMSEEIAVFLSLSDLVFRIS